MSRSARQNEKRREREEQWQESDRIRYETLAAKDATDLEYLIDRECNDMEDVRYILKRMAKVQALQLQLLKGMVK